MGVPAKDTRFLRKLYLILKEEDADIVGWSDDGRAFTIHDTARFQRVIKTKYHLSSLCTFRQNLHAHGFAEIEHPAPADAAQVDSKVNVKNPVAPASPGTQAALLTNDVPEMYFHPYFVKGYPEYLEKISFDPSVKFRCQECKRQPNDAGTKCSFRKNTFKTTRQEAAFAILAQSVAANAAAASTSPERRAAAAVAQGLALAGGVTQSPLMVHVGAPRHQREANDAAAMGKTNQNPLRANSSLSFSGAFLRPTVASLSDEQRGVQRANAAALDARAAPSSVSVSDKTKPSSGGSLMVRLSFGRKDEVRNGHPDTTARSPAQVSATTTTNGNGVASTSRDSPVQSTTTASRKEASTSKSMAKMSLQRISPCRSEEEDNGLSGDEDEHRRGAAVEASQLKSAAFPTSIYAHSKAYPGLYASGSQQAKASERFSLANEAAASEKSSSAAFAQRKPWSSEEGSRSGESFSTGSRFERSGPVISNLAPLKTQPVRSSTQSETGRNGFEHANSILADSKSVPYQQAPHWSRHNVSVLVADVRQEQRVVGTESSSREAASAPSRSRSFDPTKDEYSAAERDEQPELRRKSVEPAVLVIPKRKSMLSGPVITQIPTSAATKRIANLTVMPSIQPPMSITLSIGGRRKAGAGSEDASRKRMRPSSPVLSTIRREADKQPGQPASTENTPLKKQSVNILSAERSPSDQLLVVRRSFAPKSSSAAPAQTAASSKSAKRTSASAGMAAETSERSTAKRSRAAQSAASVPPTTQSKPAARGRKLRATLVAKAKAADGTDDETGLSLLVLASSKRN